jgi:hypothetical protein
MIPVTIRETLGCITKSSVDSIHIFLQIMPLRRLEPLTLTPHSGIICQNVRVESTLVFYFVL